MKYNGIELEEMTPEKWDGRSREMLVWDDKSPSPYKEIVLGYNPGDNYWMADDGYYWHHCAEIPKVETNMKHSIDTCIDTIETIINCAHNASWTNLYKDVITYLKSLKEIKNENKEFIAQIKSLCVERSKMANSVSSAVWKELMDRAENIDGPVNTMMAGFGFNDISDIVLNKILQYKYENNPPKEEKSNLEELSEKKVRRMTYRELAEWLAKGNGQYKASLFGDIRTELVYHSFEDDRTLDDNYLIRYWNKTEWLEPLNKE